MKQLAVVALVIGLVVLTSLIAYQSFSGRSSGPAVIDLLCTNADCGHEFNMAPGELRDALKASNRRGVLCPVCGQPSARPALRCPHEDCRRLFLRNQARAREQDTSPWPKCPHCQRQLPPPSVDAAE